MDLKQGLGPRHPRPRTTWSKSCPCNVVVARSKTISCRQSKIQHREGDICPPKFNFVRFEYKRQNGTYRWCRWSDHDLSCSQAIFKSHFQQPFLWNRYLILDAERFADRKEAWSSARDGRCWEKRNCEKTQSQMKKVVILVYLLG